MKKNRSQRYRETIRGIREIGRRGVVGLGRVERKH